MESVAGYVVGQARRPRLGEPPRSPAVPQHPIPSMQQAFAESMFDYTQEDGTPFVKPKLRTGDARARRSELIDQGRTDPPPTALWRCRPGQHTHELARLMAQMSFGVHLLLRDMATSHTLVISILQGHIDEVDEFLETTLEDMHLATADMEERIGALKVPMDNVEYFERMMEDRNYRMEILEGNQQIEHILARTQVALQQTTQDLAEGLAAIREFTIYLAEQHHGSWRQDCPDVIDIFDAMKGNTDGWFNAFMDLQAKGSALNALMVQVTGMSSEMERRAGEVSRRTRVCMRSARDGKEMEGARAVPTDRIQQFSIRPYTSPRHSPQPSIASSITTPPTSPPRTITSSPPRLSLRLSTMETGELSIHLGTQPVLDEGGGGGRTRQPSRDGATPRSLLMVTSRSPPPASPTETSPDTPTNSSGGTTPTDTPTESPTETPAETPAELPPQAPPARNPRRLSQRPSMLLEVPEVETPVESEADETGPAYMLLPRTYTPQLPSPQPSPRVMNPPPPVPEETRRSRVDSTASWGSSSSIESAAQVTVEFARPRVEMVSAKPQVIRPRMVDITAKTDPRSTPKLAQRPDPRPVSRPDPAQAPELVVPQDPEALGAQRTSLRQRISLKTNPPESIQVPPPHTLDSQRRLQAVPRAYPAPDSAYGSDMDRAAVHSMASINSSVLDFSPPFIQPGMIPSPHSERQFFRPVQASPHSPLQQRPHTSGTIGPHHFPAPPRNTPSAMGMSMMSTSTTMTNKSGGGKTVKKKRSAFNWLKKAFALDEEERAAFEHRKREQAANPYYEAKSQEFLDGRRVRPRPPY